MSTQSTVEVKQDSREQDHHGDDGHHEGEHGKELVRITIDNKPVEIHRGRQSVRDIKSLGHVPAADELAQVVHGHPSPLPDDGSVVIKGGEEFISYPKDSGSSHGDPQPAE